MSVWFLLGFEFYCENAASISGYHRLHAGWYFNFHLQTATSCSQIPPASRRVVFQLPPKTHLETALLAPLSIPQLFPHKKMVAKHPMRLFA